VAAEFADWIQGVGAFSDINCTETAHGKAENKSYEIQSRTDASARTNNEKKPQCRRQYPVDDPPISQHGSALLPIVPANRKWRHRVEAIFAAYTMKNVHEIIGVNERLSIANLTSSFHPEFPPLELQDKHGNYFDCWSCWSVIILLLR
jgi:hypothetical protein